MNKIKIYGELIDTTHDVILSILKTELSDKTKIDLKIKLLGEEITYRDDAIDIYIYTESSTPSREKGKSNYLLNGEFFGTLINTKLFLERLAFAFSKQRITYDLECFEETDGGELVGESYTIRHPDYGK